MNVKPFEALFNDNFWHELVHMYVAAFMVVGFVMAAVYSWVWLRGRRGRYERTALVTSAWTGKVSAVDLATDSVRGRHLSLVVWATTLGAVIGPGLAGALIQWLQSLVDPADPDSAYVIPLSADIDRVTPEGRLRVYETRDAGASWEAHGDGLPHEHAYLTVLREAFDWLGEGDALELYFGATSGSVFGSGDAGASWSTAALHLPPVYSVRATR